MNAPMQRLAPIARTVPWSALLTAGLACVTVLVLAPLVLPSPSVRSWPGFSALALCAGAAFLLDDEASATTGATPTSLAWRRVLLVALALPLLCVVWVGSPWYATAADGAGLGPDTRGALSPQFVAMLTLTLAVSAVALRVLAG